MSAPSDVRERPDFVVGDVAVGRDAAAAGPFLLIAALCCAFAFVGLAAGGYWIDELFTLFVIDHDGGLAEVLRRALTDTHPPAYYFLAYGWIHLFGDSEAALRALSALCAVGALGVMLVGLRGSFSLPARAFAVALGATSSLFFEYSQNARSYALCMLISAGLLALALAINRRSVADEAAPPRLVAGLWLLTLAGSFTHFYVFLAAGAVHLFLLAGARRPALRAALLASGASVFALVVWYVVALLSSTRQDLQNMWFSNEADFLGRQALSAFGKTWSGLAIPALLLLLLAPWRDRLRMARGGAPPAAPHVALWPLGLCATVVALTVAGGVAVSLALAPSFGKRNLLVLAPFMWTVGAWLYDAIAPDPRRAGGRGLIVVLVALIGANLVQLRDRALPRTEEWRASARFVESFPACRGQEIPVVLPYIFGPSTPFFRSLSERYFFGRYDAAPERLRAYTPMEFAAARPGSRLQELLTERVGGPACPVLAWGVHDLTKEGAFSLGRDIAHAAGAPADRVIVRTFYFYKPGPLGSLKRKPGGYVFLAAPGAGAATPSASSPMNR